jgi:flagellar basal-body rod modification protein FlgD
MVIGTNNQIRPGSIGAPSTQAAQGNPELDKQAFLKLMMTQMANQDPTSPQDSQEMASQLAQFSTLEAMNSTNDRLDALLLGQAVGNQTAMANLIGKDIKINSSELDHEEGALENINLRLDGPAEEVTVTIKNEHGLTVRTLQLGEQSGGSFDVEWDGLDDNGNPADEGVYTFSVGAIDADENKVESQANIVAHVEGMSFENGYPELICGDLRIPLENVLEIHESSV